MPMVQASTPLDLPGGQAQVTRRRPKFSSSYASGGLPGAAGPSKRLGPVKRMAFEHHEQRAFHKFSSMHEETGM